MNAQEQLEGRWSRRSQFDYAHVNNTVDIDAFFIRGRVRLVFPLQNKNDARGSEFMVRLQSDPPANPKAEFLDVSFYGEWGRILDQAYQKGQAISQGRMISVCGAWIRPNSHADLKEHTFRLEIDDDCADASIQYSFEGKPWYIAKGNLHDVLRIDDSQACLSKRGSKRKSMETYKYSTLAEIHKLPDKSTHIHVYGVVTSFEARPLQTKNKSWYTKMDLVDDSSGPAAKVQLFGSESLDKHPLPIVKSVGDIVRIHRADVNYYQDKLQLVGKLHRGSNVVVVSGRVGDDILPPPKATWSEDDDRRVSQLRNWYSQRRVSQSQFDGSEFVKSMQDISGPTDLFDMVAQIVGIEGGSPSSLRHTLLGPCPTLYVWDGRESSVGSRGGPCFYEAIDRSVPSMQKRAGSIMPVIVTHAELKDTMQGLASDTWVFLKRIRVKELYGGLFAEFDSHSSFNVIGTDIKDVRDRIFAYEKRCQELAEECNRPGKGLEDSTSVHNLYPHIDATPLSSVVEASEPCGKFRVSCCAVKIFPPPSRAEDCCVDVCAECKIVLDEPWSDRKYRCMGCSASEATPLRTILMKVSLKDTASDACVDAILADEDAAEFLGIAAAEFTSSNDKCVKAMSVLRGLVESSARLDVNIKMFSPNDQPEKRVYRLFGCKLVY